MSRVNLFPLGSEANGASYRVRVMSLCSEIANRARSIGKRLVDIADGADNDDDNGRNDEGRSIGGQRATGVVTSYSYGLSFTSISIRWLVSVSLSLSVHHLSRDAAPII